MAIYSEEEDGNVVHLNNENKRKIIEKIKAITKEFGSFGIGEVQADCSPCVNSIGRLVALAEHFSDNVDIEVYDPKKFNSDSIDSYTVEYEELEEDILEEILGYATIYEADQIAEGE